MGEEIGRGAFGVVVRARHRRLGNEVAIKQLVASVALDANARSRFLAEARMLATFDHPYIVRVHDFVEEDDACFLIMERLTGGTVRDRQRAGVPVQTACAIAVVAASGLHYAHGRGILHRDIKPENLMFSGEGVLKVTDFGIAKNLSGGETASTMTGMILGTPDYIAPEQVVGGQLTPATDVYALGTLLYELIAGEAPFPRAPDAMVALFRHANEEPRTLREVAPQTPVALAEVIDRAVARRPEDRHPTAEAFSGALSTAASTLWGADWLGGSGVVVREVGARPDRSPAAPTIVEEPWRPVAATVPTAEPVRRDDRVVTADLTPGSPNRRSVRRVWFGIGAAVAVIGAIVLVTQRGSTHPGGRSGSASGVVTTGASPPTSAADAGGSVPQDPTPGVFESQPGGPSRFGTQDLVRVSGVLASGHNLALHFDATGTAVQRDPTSSCVQVRAPAGTFSSLPTAWEPAPGAGEWHGTLTFPLVLPGDYSFSYSCQADFSLVPLGHYTRPIVGVSAFTTPTYFAAVSSAAQTASGLTLTVEAAGPTDLRTPDTSCLSVNGQPVSGATTVDYQSRQDISSFVIATITFRNVSKGAFTYSCLPDYSSVMVG